jgi:hypothetical protein
MKDNTPVKVSFTEKKIVEFIHGLFFGLNNPLSITICLPGIIMENPKHMLALLTTYSSILGALTTLIAMGYTVKYAIRIVKNVIRKIKHRKVKPNESKIINKLSKNVKKIKNKSDLINFVKKFITKEYKIKSTVLNKTIIKFKKTQKFKKIKVTKKQFKFGTTQMSQEEKFLQMEQALELKQQEDYKNRHKNFRKGFVQGLIRPTHFVLAPTIYNNSKGYEGRELKGFATGTLASVAALGGLGYLARRYFKKRNLKT